MASKDNSPAISFFSFQDIITSITGIMFLVVIMLVLMVLQQAPDTSQQKNRELQEELTTLEAELKKIRDSLSELRKQAAAQKKNIERLKQLRIEQLPDLKKEWLLKLQQIDSSIEQLEEESKQLLQSQKDQIELSRKKESLIRKNKERSDELKQEIVSLEKEIQDKEKIFLKFKNVIRFVWNQATAKAPVLLECSDKEISVNSLDEKFKRRTFTNYNECLAFCRKLPPDDTYFILLLKPSAFFYGEKFSRELQKLGYDLGREILPDDQTIIFGGQQK